MRHARFAIGEAERDAWLHHMRVALDALAPDEALAAQLGDYLVMAAHSLVNVDPAHGRPDLGLRPAGGGSQVAGLGQVCTARWPVTS